MMTAPLPSCHGKCTCPSSQQQPGPASWHLPLPHLDPPLLPRFPCRHTCPTAARACFLASWLGLADRPKRWQPTPTAPLVTMTTWWPEGRQGRKGERGGQLADTPKRWEPTPTAPLVTMTTWWPEEGQGKMGGREREAKESWEGGGELGGAESHAITAKVPSQAMHGNRTRRLWL